jgi:hypothetical protein
MKLGTQVLHCDRAILTNLQINIIGKKVIEDFSGGVPLRIAEDLVLPFFFFGHVKNVSVSLNNDNFCPWR